MTTRGSVGLSWLGRELLFALAVAIACYALSCLLVAPGPTAVTFGAQWQQMSEAPFALTGQFPHRLLGPLLAWCIGLGGDHFVVHARGLAVLLLTTVCFFCRRRGAAPVDAMLITLAIAVTAAVQMYKLNWVGFVDPLGYALSFAALSAGRRPVLFWSLFFANLLNHELAVFLLPWLWFVRRQVNGSRRADVVGAGLAIAAYGVFYLWVKAAAPVQKYDAGYFLTNPMFPGGTVVIVTLAITHWVVAFGPVLAVIAWHQHTRSHGRERLHTWLVLGGMLAIFCIAWDWSRHGNLVILPLVLASVRFLQAGHRASYLALVVAGVVGMLWIPPWPIGAWPTSAMADVELLFRTGAAVSNPATGEPMGGPVGRVLGEWLPAVWPTLWPILAIGAAIWLTGLLLARRDRAG
ncbi:MAG: hypothetical protein MUC36_23285 [Planctomycetes bacterium]|jgi:hypothetical protein|nr:hypothetical protein [Planctomycetota bacterium]